LIANARHCLQQTPQTLLSPMFILGAFLAASCQFHFIKNQISISLQYLLLKPDKSTQFHKPIAFYLKSLPSSLFGSHAPSHACSSTTPSSPSNHGQHTAHHGTNHSHNSSAPSSAPSSPTSASAPSANLPPYKPERPLSFVSDADEKPKRSAAANFLLRQWQVKKSGLPLVTPRSGGLDVES